MGLDFNTTDLVDRLIEGNNNFRKLICNKVWRETQFKTLHRVYVPFFISQAPSDHHSLTSKCPKCRVPGPILAHCLWYCLKVLNLWHKMAIYIREVTTTRIAIDPLLCIFGITPEATEKQGKQLLNGHRFSC